MWGRTVLAAMVLAACYALPVAASAAVKIKVLSNRADLISGGDALVEVAGADPASVRVKVDGRDVTGAFAVRENGRFQGFLTGLRLGRNDLTARTRRKSGARISITNHPIGGPVISGPQTQPWLCRTEENGLGPALDAQCNAPTKVEWLYKSANLASSGLQPYDPANPPPDVATTTTDHAGRVPFIVRVERGVIDRGIYEIAVLADPKQPWDPWAPQKAWNGKLYWAFGGDCQPNHVQPAPGDSGAAALTGPPLNEKVLGRGFAMAASGLTVLGLNCNSVVSAEAVMMIKERIAESLGPIRYTMSEGCSGGSMQQHWHVSNYPGLLDGIQPSCSYPDIWTTMQQAEDCHVLDHYFREVSPHLWAVLPQQEFVTGYAAPTTCASFWNGPPPISYAQNWLDPDNYLACLGGALSGGNLPVVTGRPEWVYDAQSNRSGVRCTLQDYMASIFGRRASDGFANYPYDNVGVQYGLSALNSGQIAAEQFLDLNEKVGGLDVDWNYQPQRSEADLAAVRTMYRAGLVTFGREAAKVPIIDLRATSNLEIHTDFHSYAMRARLQKASGHADNQIIWTSPLPLLADPTFANGSTASTPESFALLDRWLSRIEADTSDRTLEDKVRRNRPAEAVDACWIAGQKITDMQQCRAAFPHFADPRIAAGGPLADDVIKCQLKPLDRSDYEVEFTDEQWARLHNAFPTGVCDYSRPGVGQEPSIPWMSFANGPGGTPLGDAPRSVALGACASAAGFRSVAATPRGRGVRFEADRRQSRPFRVGVFRQSRGRRVLREKRRVARFRNRTAPFTWRARRLPAGNYFARFTMRLDRGRDVRRIALRYGGGRFRLAPAFHQRIDCGTFRTLKLSSSVFGGSTRAPLGIAVRLARAADRLTIVARSGKRVIKRWQIRRPRAGRTFRRRLRAAAVPRGRTIRVGVTATRGSRRTRGQVLTARRL